MSKKKRSREEAYERQKYLAVGALGGMMAAAAVAIGLHTCNQEPKADEQEVKQEPQAAATVDMLPEEDGMCVPPEEETSPKDLAFILLESDIPKSHYHGTACRNIRTDGDNLIYDTETTTYVWKLGDSTVRFTPMTSTLYHRIPSELEIDTPEMRTIDIGTNGLDDFPHTQIFCEDGEMSSRYDQVMKIDGKLTPESSLNEFSFQGRRYSNQAYAKQREKIIKYIQQRGRK